MNKPATLAKLKDKPTAGFYIAAEAKLARLRALSADALMSLNEPAEEVEIADGRRGKIAVIVEREHEGAAFVVVQGFLPSRILPFIKHVYADGFRKRRDGTIAELKAEELYDYD